PVASNTVPSIVPVVLCCPNTGNATAPITSRQITSPIAWAAMERSNALRMGVLLSNFEFVLPSSGPEMHFHPLIAWEGGHLIENFFIVSTLMILNITVEKRVLT